MSKRPSPLELPPSKRQATDDTILKYRVMTSDELDDFTKTASHRYELLLWFIVLLEKQYDRETIRMFAVVALRAWNRIDTKRVTIFDDKCLCYNILEIYNGGYRTYEKIIYRAEWCAKILNNFGDQNIKDGWTLSFNKSENGDRYYYVNDIRKLRRVVQFNN